MKWQTFKIITKSSLLITIAAVLIRCNAPALPEWYDTNQALISEHNLSVRELSGLPGPAVESNLEAGKVNNLETLGSTTQWPAICQIIPHRQCAGPER